MTPIVWLLSLGLMATPASFVVDTEFVRLSRTPRPDAIDPAALLMFKGEACETSEPDRKTPWWSCRIHGQTVSGYAPRAAFRPKTGEQEASPPGEKPFDEWFSSASAEGDPKRRDALLFNGVVGAFSLDARRCLEGSASRCQGAVAWRLMLHWNARVLESPLPPARPGKVLACSAGETPDGCLERLLGPGTLGGGAEQRSGSSAFVYVLPQPPRAVRFVTGEVHSVPGAGQPGQTAYQVEVYADESREDPLLLEVLRASGADMLPVSFGMPRVLESSRYVLAVGGVKAFWTDRPLDKGLFVLCGNETRKVEKPKLVGVSLHLEELVSVLFPMYHYALPCKASFVLDESIPGIRVGKRGPERTCTVQRKEPEGAAPEEQWIEPLTFEEEKGRVPFFTFQEDPVTGDCRVELRNVREGSRVVFSGDLNGDSRPDFIISLVGDMNCSGPRLFLSSPQGWFLAGLSNYIC